MDKRLSHLLTLYIKMTAVRPTNTLEDQHSLPLQSKAAGVHRSIT